MSWWLAWLNMLALGINLGCAWRAWRAGNRLDRAADAYYDLRCDLARSHGLETAHEICWPCNHG